MLYHGTVTLLLVHLLEGWLEALGHNDGRGWGYCSWGWGWLLLGLFSAFVLNYLRLVYIVLLIFAGFANNI